MIQCKEPAGFSVFGFQFLVMSFYFSVFGFQFLVFSFVMSQWDEPVG